MPCSFAHAYCEDGCQFSVPEEELEEFDNKQWCRYHLPMKSEAGEESPKAHLGAERIALGTVQKILPVSLSNFPGE